MLVMNACRALLSHQSLLRLVLLQQTAEISTSTNNLDAATDDTSQGSEVRPLLFMRQFSGVILLHIKEKV